MDGQSWSLLDGCMVGHTRGVGALFLSPLAIAWQHFTAGESHGIDARCRADGPAGPYSHEDLSLRHDGRW